MLILSREVGQIVRINDDILVKIVDVKGKYVRLGFEAPESVVIDRDEVYQRKQEKPNATGSETETGS